MEQLLPAALARVEMGCGPPGDGDAVLAAALPLFSGYVAALRGMAGGGSSPAPGDSQAKAAARGAQGQPKQAAPAALELSQSQLAALGRILRAVVSWVTSFLG